MSKGNLFFFFIGRKLASLHSLCLAWWCRGRLWPCLNSMPYILHRIKQLFEYYLHVQYVPSIKASPAFFMSSSSPRLIRSSHQRSPFHQITFEIHLNSEIKPLVSGRFFIAEEWPYNRGILYLFLYSNLVKTSSVVPWLSILSCDVSWYIVDVYHI